MQFPNSDNAIQFTATYWKMLYWYCTSVCGDILFKANVIVIVNEKFLDGGKHV